MNKLIRFKASILFALIFLSGLVYSQDPVFTQFDHSSSNAINIENNLNSKIGLGMNQKNQRLSSIHSISTSQFMFSYPILGTQDRIFNMGGVGASLLNSYSSDKTVQFYNADVQVVYNLGLTQDSMNVVSFCLNGGVIGLQLQMNQFNTGAQYQDYQFTASLANEIEGINASSKAIDFGYNVMYEYNPHFGSNSGKINVKFFVEMDHLTQPNLSLSTSNYRYPMMFRTMILTGFKLGTNSCLRIGFQYLSQASVSLLDPGVFYEFWIKKNESKTPIIFGLGSYFRIGESFSPSISMMHSNFKAGFAYNYVYNSAKVFSSSGSIEFFLGLLLTKPRRVPRENILKEGGPRLQSNH